MAGTGDSTIIDRIGRSQVTTVVAAGLFAGYVGLVIIAGAWGAFGPAHIDQRWLFDLDVADLAPGTKTDLLSQYRFLRGIELAFGLAAARYWREIFHDRRFGVAFLAAMSIGVLARVAGLLWEGSPGLPFWFFLASEGAGAVAIWLAARVRWSAT